MSEQSTEQTPPLADSKGAPLAIGDTVKITNEGAARWGWAGEVVRHHPGHALPIIVSFIGGHALGFRSWELERIELSETKP